MTLYNPQKKKNTLSDSINLIPMINLIFLLLIFFMLTGVIEKKENIDVDRPVSENGLETKSSKSEAVIILRADGELFHNNELINLKTMTQNLSVTSSKKIIIDVDKKAKIFKFNELLDELKNSGKREIYIKVVDKENVSQ